jgi:hypothetical protein
MKKKTKINNDGNKKDDKEDTLTKILIFIIFIILVFYVPQLWKDQIIQRGFWELRAKDNLEASFNAIQGDDYVFVEGVLQTKCDKLEAKNHCPRLVENKGDNFIYFDDKFLYRANLSIFQQKDMAARFELTPVNFMLFKEKGEARAFTLSLRINDYVLAQLCRDKLFNNTTCSIRWNKNFQITNITEKRKDVIVNITTFDTQLTDNAVKTEVSGMITGNLMHPKLEARVYTLFNHTLTLDSQQNLSLSQENGHYAFKANIIFPIKVMLVSEDAGYSDDETNINYTQKKTTRSVLIILRDQNYFYAREKIIQGNTSEEKTYT